MSDHGYSISENVFGQLEILKDGQRFVTTNLEPMYENDFAWDQIGIVLDALIADREKAKKEGRIEGLRLAARIAGDLSDQFHRERRMAVGDPDKENELAIMGYASEVVERFIYAEIEELETG